MGRLSALAQDRQRFRHAQFRPSVPKPLSKLTLTMYFVETRKPRASTYEGTHHILIYWRPFSDARSESQWLPVLIPSVYIMEVRTPVYHGIQDSGRRDCVDAMLSRGISLKLLALVLSS